MKKTAIIIAILLIVTGLVIIGAALAVYGFDGFSGKLTEKTYTPGEEFDSIVIDVDTAVVRLLPSADGVCRAVSRESEEQPFAVSVKEGTLTVSHNDTRRWHQKIFNFKSPEIAVYLPAEEYKAVSIKTVTGDIALSRGLSFGSAAIEGTTSDISVFSSVSGELSIGLSTGDVTVDGTNPSSIKIEGTTGNVSVNRIKDTAAIDVKLSTGDVKMLDVECGSLAVKTSTGDIELDKLTVKGALNLKTTTGDVKLSHLGAEGIEIETTTGDVDAVLSSDMIVYASTTTGDIDITEATEGGICRVKTTTGDITVKSANK